nr:hypothetical protein [Candidatus Sigynarchaeum springense]
MDANKDYLNLAKTYRANGYSLGIILISLTGYFVGLLLIVIFMPFSSEGTNFNLLWGVVIFITLGVCSTNLAFTCISIRQLHKTSKHQDQSFLVSYLRLKIATTCIGIMVTTWCCIWLFMSMCYKPITHYDPEFGYWDEIITIRLWPGMTLASETWIKLMYASLPAIGVAIVFIPFYWKQIQKIKPIFPPSQNHWFPSSGHE